MALKLSQPRLVAVDTNVALDFAKGIDDVCDAIATIRARVPGVELWVPPTVVEEVAHAVISSKDQEIRRAAFKILRQHRELGLRLFNFIPVGFEYVDEVSQSLRRAGLLPKEEVHDSLIVAEAAALNCVLLTSSDDHLRNIDYAKLSRALAKFDLNAPLIATPREIVRKFFR